ncbi:MAG TPA: DUF72 domain-containing protein [Polyangia bacterium]|nr:DUF72 domain-containing protein [Polyangia bacterium]
MGRAVRARRARGAGHALSPRRRERGQPALFALPPPTVEPAPFAPELEAMAAHLPAALRLGTMSWSYPGWRGIVYAAEAASKTLAPHGLTAYARHPLFRTVEIDRTYYEPLPADDMAAYAAQVPDDFRFVVKAQDACVFSRFPTHARYGARAGEANGLFLDPGYAADAVIAPIIEGLGAKLGVILFQFPPQDVGDGGSFAARLGAFLARLPKGPTYAVELRNRALVSPAYGDALAGAGAVHVHSVWSSMPALADQARRLPPETRRPLFVRWLFPRGDTHEEAGARYEPFSRLVDEDVDSRAAVAALAVRALAHDVPAFVTVDNKAEGCSPESIVRLAREIAARREASTSL